MRKLGFIGVLLIVCIIFILLLFCGFKLGPIHLMSYDEIEKANMNRKSLLSELNDKNTNEYKNKEAELKKLIQVYQTTKNRYDRLVSSGKISPDEINKFIDIYDFNSLWEIIDNYAKERNVELNFDISQSETMSIIPSDYTMCDLKFDVKGEYIEITDFLYNLEDDDRLNFEISNFELKNDGDELEANFIVKEIAINTASMNK